MPKNSAIDRLVRNIPENTYNGNIPKIEALVTAVKAICQSLSAVTGEYKAQDTISQINNFVSSEDKTFRIIYSEINSWYMSLGQEKRGAVLSNIDSLLQFVTKNTSINNTTIKIVFKIYDHFQLINAQIANIKSTSEPLITEVQESFKNDIKIIEREHTTILGIFAAIVLAFVGTFTFSTAVLNNIVNTPVLKLGMIACELFVAFYCIISLLVNFLREINGKQRISQGITKKVIFIIVIISFIAGIILGKNLDVIKNYFMV